MLTPIQAVQLRKELGRVLVAVATTHKRFVIHRAGIPTAVLVPVQEYEQLVLEARGDRSGTSADSQLSAQAKGEETGGQLPKMKVASEIANPKPEAPEYPTEHKEAA